MPIKQGGNQSLPLLASNLLCTHRDGVREEEHRPDAADDRRPSRGSHRTTAMSVPLGPEMRQARAWTLGVTKEKVL